MKIVVWIVGAVSVMMMIRAVCHWRMPDMADRRGIYRDTDASMLLVCPLACALLLWLSWAAADAGLWQLAPVLLLFVPVLAMVMLYLTLSAVQYSAAELQVRDGWGRIHRYGWQDILGAETVSFSTGARVGAQRTEVRLHLADRTLRISRMTDAGRLLLAELDRQRGRLPEMHREDDFFHGRVKNGRGWLMASGFGLLMLVLLTPLMLGGGAAWWLLVLAAFVAWVLLGIYAGRNADRMPAWLLRLQFGRDGFIRKDEKE